MRSQGTRAVIATVLALGACDDGWHEGEPVDRALTSWHAIPSADESRLAMTLEPRHIHRDEQGVLVLGHKTTLAGPSLAIEIEGAPLTTLARGTSDVARGDTRAWLMQTELTEWDHAFPTASPPRAPLVRSTLLDLATFAASPSVALSPPIDIPVVVGDELFDVPASGASDIARSMYIRLRNDDGSDFGS